MLWDLEIRVDYFPFVLCLSSQGGFHLVFKGMAVPLLIFSMFTVPGDSKSVVKLQEWEQMRQLVSAERACLTNIQVMSIPVEANVCEAVWDNVLCWEYTPAGQVARQHCPNYINNFDTDAFATRECLPDGTWYFHPENNSTWTNFTLCKVNTSELPPVKEIPELLQEHMPNLRLMYSVGYSVSLASLFIAVFLMIFFKKLHCQRNRLHLNLFTSFITRCMLSLLRENILSEGGAFLPTDVIYDENNRLKMGPGTHWRCKLLQTSFHFVIGANYTWIFLEGLYLHMLIFVSFFTGKNKLKWYMLFGWGFPALSVGAWVVVRIHYEDVHCWLTNSNSGFFWILRGPIVASIIANFIFFLNIIRVLVVKLRASNNPDSKKFRYRRLAKSTLVLIPLFGVHYMVFLAKPDHVDAKVELILLYTEMFLNSFQGFMVTLLFCFLNGEVQAEVMKIWRRRTLSRGGSFRSKTWTSLSSHWGRHRSNVETKRSKPRRRFRFGARGSDSAFTSKRSGIESEDMSSAAERCIEEHRECIQLDIIKEVRDDLSKSSSKEESGQSDHNDNLCNNSLHENKNQRNVDVQVEHNR